MQDELGKHGFELVQVVFDAPTKEWASTLSAPTLNLFLYDIRETQGPSRPSDWESRNDEEGRRFDVRPPLRVDVAYAVTAWTRNVEDEHRMLSQALAILFAFPILPRDELTGSLRNGSQRFPLHTRIAQERSDGGSNFWTAVGGQYKASLDYVVTLSCEPGTLIERGPEVRTQTLRTQRAGSEEATREEAHRFGGTVRDENGDPVAGRLGRPPRERPLRRHRRARRVHRRARAAGRAEARRARPRRRRAGSQDRRARQPRGHRAGRAREAAKT